MILKELGEASAAADRFAQAGRRAEEQMAFYLHRAFKDAGSLAVINGLRLADGRDVAQIDHLVIHRYGMVVVESKSVTTTVQINDHGEWSRWYNGAWRGMPSPILQAQRQADFLRGYLDAQREILRDKVLFRQAGFQGMPIDVVVAISDAGIIERSTRLAVDEVCKAEQVTSRVQAIVETYRAADRASNGLFKLKTRERGSAYTASTDEMARITRFLLDCHTPPDRMAARAPAESQPAPAPSSNVLVVDIGPVCRQCKSDHVAVAYGYNYFFRCLDCHGSTPIKETCSGCGARLVVRKSGRQYYLDCRPCGTSALFFTNPAGEVR